MGVSEECFIWVIHDLRLEFGHFKALRTLWHNFIQLFLSQAVAVSLLSLTGIASKSASFNSAKLKRSHRSGRMHPNLDKLEWLKLQETHASSPSFSQFMTALITVPALSQTFYTLPKLAVLHHTACLCIQTTQTGLQKHIMSEKRQALNMWQCCPSLHLVLLVLRGSVG